MNKKNKTMKQILIIIMIIIIKKLQFMMIFLKCIICKKFKRNSLMDKKANNQIKNP